MGAVLRLFRLAETRGLLLRLAALLLAVRIAIHLPLFPEVRDATPAFQKDPYLVLLDLFSGGAMARGSVLSLGLYPLWLARPLAFLSPKLQRGSWGDSERRQFQKTWSQIAILLPLALGWIYPAFLSRVTGMAIAAPGLGSALALAAGTALSLWFANLLDKDDIGRGLKLLAVFHVLAALPHYFFVGCSAPAEKLERVLCAVMAAAVYLMLSQAERRVPVRYVNHPREGRRVGTDPYLPLGLNLSRIAPLLWVLVGFGLLRYLSLFLAHSQIDGIRGLAGHGLRLTDLSAPQGWLAFVLMGFLAKWMINLSSMSGIALQRQFKIEGGFLPGALPGRDTAGLIDRSFGRLAWIEPLVTVGTIAAAALWAESTRPGSWWPVLLVPVLFAVLPLRELAAAWRAQLLLHDNEGFLKRGRR
jgi:preprotein translocase subunit SecY